MKKALKIAVVGDIMLDIYHYGSVKRISPEFPVPILLGNKRTITRLGGSANVAAQLIHFNVKPSLFGLVDQETREVLSHYNFCLDGCVSLPPEVYNPRKIRYYDDDFPLLRFDQEEVYEKQREEVLERFTDNFDIVILSNYSKGLFDKQFAQTIIKKSLTIVDPKCNLDWWKGCTIFKPNQKEANSFYSGNYKEQADYLKNYLGCSGVVITRAGEGVSGLEKDYFNYEPKNLSKDVSSVIGAGDCFAAILALGLGNGFSLERASQIAFEGGREYVKAKNNKPITWYELNRRLNPVEGKFVSADELIYLKKHLLVDQKLVMTNGCYDLMHIGHLDTLNFAKSLGHRLVVAVNSDESVRRLKGERRPIQKLVDRMTLLANLECVDFVVSFDADTPYELIEKINPDIVVKGNEYSGKKVAGDGFNGEIVLAPMREKISTTNIIERIYNNYGT